MFELISKIRSTLSFAEWDAAVECFLNLEDFKAPYHQDEKVFRDKELAFFLFGSSNSRLSERIQQIERNMMKNCGIGELISFANYFSGFHVLHDDTLFMRRLLKRDGWFLKYAFERLKDDISTVSVALGSTFSALEFASERLRSDEKLVKNTC